MGKRLFDKDKFNKPWYRKLTLLQKVIWEYLTSECDHAGLIEKFDLELMSFKIGSENQIQKSDLEFLKDKIQFINEDTIFIPKFIKFQYGKLNPKNKVHLSVLKRLREYGINPELLIEIISDNISDNKSEESKINKKNEADIG